MKCLTFLVIFFSVSSLSAKESHLALRRIVVFPLKSQQKYADQAEKSWWSMRKKLTEGQRFLVASKNFLVQKDVYDPRTELDPADAILLGRLLDAQLLVTSEISDKTFTMRVYLTGKGDLAWQKAITFHPALPIIEQIEDVSLKVLGDFITSIPYQAFVVKDSLKETVLYKEKGDLFVHVYVGSKNQSGEGDLIQFIDVRTQNDKPLFQEGGFVEVFAEGHVVEKSSEVLKVKLSRYVKGVDWVEGMAVRIPKEYQRLRESIGVGESISINPHSLGVNPEMISNEEELKESKPLVSSLFFIGSLALFLVLAF